MTYRTGRHWQVTIVREGVEPPDEYGKRPDAQLIAVVVNGDQALAERICALLNASEGLGDRDQRAVKSRRRRTMTPRLLARVAAVYRTALSEGRPPTQAVADHFGTPHRTATRWVAAARGAGELGAALGTVAGEDA